MSARAAAGVPAAVPRAPAAAAGVPAAVPGAAAATARTTRWCITLNNPPADADLPHWLVSGTDGVAYGIWQLERGHSGGTPHLQAYIRFANAKALGGVKRIVGNSAHAEPARGSEESNIAYCSKVDTRERGPWSTGRPAEPGKRTDLDSACASIRENGGKLSGIDDSVLVKYHKGLLFVASEVRPPRRDDLVVICIIGSTGIGKTYSCFTAFPDLYRPVFGNSGLWWDGYREQSEVLFDEFEGQIPLTKLLQLLDPYPQSLEVKGGSIAARFNVAIITSNRLPEEWYPNKFTPGANIGLRDASGRANLSLFPEQYKALLRRLGEGTPRFIVAKSRDELHSQFDALALHVPRLQGALASIRAQPAPPPAPVPIPPDRHDESSLAAVQALPPGGYLPDPDLPPLDIDHYFPSAPRSSSDEEDVSMIPSCSKYPRFLGDDEEYDPM